MIPNLCSNMSQLRIFLKPNILSLPCIQLAKNMSAFPKSYLEPVFERKQLQELKESGEAAQRSHLSVRPPLVYQTSSESFDEMAAKLCNYVMKMGNKKLSRELVGKAFETIKRIQIEKYHKATTEEAKQKIDLDPISILHKAVENSTPMLILQPVKRGAVKYQVPTPVTRKRSRFIAMRWLVRAGIDKDSKVRFYTQLAHELIDASLNRGRVVKQKTDLHKQCEANRAYAHYRWG